MGYCCIRDVLLCVLTVCCVLEYDWLAARLDETEDDGVSSSPRVKRC